MRILSTLVLLAAVPASVVAAQSTSPQLAAQWRSDLRTIVRLVDSAHPWPWRRISSDSFHALARQLDRAIPTLREERIVSRAMELVASLHDGHTTLQPPPRAPFTSWFPVRFHQFADSLAIVATDSSHASLLGARVLRIGGEPALVTTARVARLRGTDNEWGAHQLAGMLSNAGVMRALRLSRDGSLELEVLGGRAGTLERVRLEAIPGTSATFGWMYRGEMFGPPGISMITAFGMRAPLEYRRMSPDLPLHLRNRIPIWFTWLPEDSTLYLQSNFVQDFGGTSFAAVVDSVFAAAEDHPVRRFILDLRYNSGGDGSKLGQFVHGMIRRPQLDQPGRFIVLTGGKTFSAAILWLSELKEHTTVITVGEPAGAARNHSGDAGSVQLPGTGMELQISTLRHYGTRSDDTTRAELPDFPIPMTARDYFAGRDPALEFARQTPELRSIPQLAVALGPDRALAEARQRVLRFGSVPGWKAFDERQMNSAGYSLLEAGRVAEAVAVLRANTDAFPRSGNTWDSLGEALLASGDTSGAVASYRKSMDLDPGNENAREVVGRLGKP